MLDHASIAVTDLERSAAFYDAVLGTLGYQRRKQVQAAIGYGPPDEEAAVFWILAGEPAAAARGLHWSFRATDRETVRAFHAKALERGGRDAGAPGARPEYAAAFYAAFVLDPDGYKIEAVCRRAGPEAEPS